MKNLESKIKQNWHPSNKESKRIIASFKIKQNGELSSCKIIQSSDDDAQDNAALNAIKSSAPFEPLPKAFKGNSIDIEFTFDYKKLPDSNKNTQNTSGK